jgi:hypothetical protein
MNIPKVIIVHHSGGIESDPLFDTSNQTFEIIRDYHVSLGWGDIGYNWLIEKSGKICKGRDEDIDGAHTIGMNNQSIGICLVGNFDLTLPTKEQEESLKIVYQDLITRYPNLKDQIFPHRKYSTKTCYGENLSDNWAYLLVQDKKEVMTNSTIGALKLTLLNNRMKSFYWRTGMMMATVLISAITGLLPTLSLPQWVLVLSGLMLGEISKLVNQTIQQNS